MKIDFDDPGIGPALLFPPDSYSTGVAWRAVQKALGGSYRMISPHARACAELIDGHLGPLDQQKTQSNTPQTGEKA